MGNGEDGGLLKKQYTGGTPDQTNLFGSTKRLIEAGLLASAISLEAK